MTNILVILGETVVKKDVLSDTSIQRLEKGLGVWHGGGYSRIVVTGGIFLPRTIQTRPIAYIMRDWLLDHGIPRDVILVEEFSVDTYENIRFVDALLLKEYGSMPKGIITLVSHTMHVKRAYMSARELGWRVTMAPVRSSVGIMQSIKERAMRVMHHKDPLGYNRFSRWNRARRRKAVVS